MWTVLKFDRNCLEFMISDLKKKLGDDFEIYCPKILIQSYKNNKLINKEHNILGDYIFCFHKSFEKSSSLETLRFTKGLKYFLGGYKKTQSEIQTFIKKCKALENDKGLLSQIFFHLSNNIKYKFSSGPFTDMIFKIIDYNKNRINLVLEGMKSSIKLNRNSNYTFLPL